MSKPILSKRVIDLLFALVVPILSADFVLERLKLSAFYGQVATPAMLVEGTAYLPYQSRVLIPWLVYILRDGLHFEYLSVLQVFRFFEFMATIGLAFALRYYLSLFISDWSLASISACSVFYILPFNFTQTLWYPWDIPAVLFFTLGLTFIYKRYWLGYYLLFAVATLNRETTLLLVGLYVLAEINQATQWRMGLGVAAQLLIWGSIRYGLYHVYRHNPQLGNGWFELQIMHNIVRLQDPTNVIDVLSVYGFIWIPIIMWRSWIDNAFVKKTLWLIPALFVIMGGVGVIHELRIYGEGIPVVLSAFWVILRNLFQKTAGLSNPHPNTTGI